MQQRDQKKRLSGVDWAIILMTVLLLTAGGLWLWRSLSFAGEVTRIRYTIRLKNMDEEIFESAWRTRLIPGVSVTSANGTLPLGTVISVSQKPHLSPTVQDGRALAVSVAGRVDIDVTVEAEATFTAGNGVRVSDIRIAAGDTGSFRVGEFYLEQAHVVSVLREGIYGTP